MAKNLVHWFEIYVSDMERAKAFYGKVFEVSFERMPTPHDSTIEMWMFPYDHQGSGAAGALVKLEEVSPGGSTLVYFSCEDCAQLEKKVITAGGTVARPKTSLGENGAFSLVIDSEGNMIGLHSDN